VRIEVCAQRDPSDCARLQPIVDLLVAHGNRVRAPFSTDKGGETYCSLADPIDFDLVAEHFDLVWPVVVDREADVINIHDDEWQRCGIWGRRFWLWQMDHVVRWYARTLREKAGGAPAELPAVTDGLNDETPIELILGDLLNGGNVLVNYTWGWEAGDRSAEVRDPIDFDRVRAAFVLPEWIVLDEAHDCIRDVAHDYLLKGPGFSAS